MDSAWQWVGQEGSRDLQINDAVGMEKEELKEIGEQSVRQDEMRVSAGE